MWITAATLTLPDGRQLHASETWYREYDTNAVIVTNQTIEWLHGEELTADEQNELIGDDHLHEWVSGKLSLMKAEPLDFDDDL